MRVLIGVTGSIAAYKAAEVVSALRADASAEELQALMVAQGSPSLAADALLRASTGQTSLEEVMRALALR